MNNLYVFDPTQKDPLSQFRGGGRIIQILKENLPARPAGGPAGRQGLPEAKFINNLNELRHYYLSHDRGQDNTSVFLNPIFQPFQPPLTLKRLAKKQIQIIFDVIPLKYPNHFPAGIRGKLNLFLNKLALKNYDKIITISNHSKKDIVQYLQIPESKIEVVYPTVSKIFIPNVILNSFQDLKKMPKWFDFAHHPEPVEGQVRHDNMVIKQYNNITIPQNFCLYVGDVNWNKNLVNLARAIKIINVTCVFVGKAFEKMTGGAGGRAPDSAQRSEHWREGNPRQNLSRLQLSHPWQKEFRDFLTEVGDDKRFIFLGYVPDSQLIKLYQQARLNILVSRDEGFGFSFFEAASQSCPSVLSDIEVFHETAADSTWFANPNDVNDIANKIGEIYFNKDLRDKLGKKAKERSRLFSRERFRKDLLKAIM